MFPGYRVRAITNGVHPFTWTAPSFRELYDQGGLTVVAVTHEERLAEAATRIVRLRDGRVEEPPAGSQQS